jgi:2-phosphosulfolactate phosphatase
VPGTIIDRLLKLDPTLVLSSDAEVAVLAFRSLRPLEACPSGVELVEQGFADDVRIAGQLDESRAVPVLKEGRFVAH